MIAALRMSSEGVADLPFDALDPVVQGQNLPGLAVGDGVVRPGLTP